MRKMSQVGASPLLFSLLGAVICAGCHQKQSPPPRPPQVQVARAIEKDVSIYGEWVATLDGYVNAQHPTASHWLLIKQAYREGSLVHKNDVLFEIDPRPSAVLDQAKAQLAQAQAQLGMPRSTSIATSRKPRRTQFREVNWKVTPKCKLAAESDRRG